MNDAAKQRDGNILKGLVAGLIGGLIASWTMNRFQDVWVKLVEAIIGDKIAPGFADWYLARNGCDAQQTDEPVEPDRRDNLWESVPGDHGAHGTFDDRASASSPQLWASKNRKWLTLGGVGVAGVALGVLLKRTLKNKV